MKQPCVSRVLHIVSAMDRGGAESLIMNVYRNIDKSKIQFDFVIHRPEKGDFDAEIIKMGGIIYKIPSLGETGPIRYVKNLVKIMKLNPYIAVHSHTDYQGGFPSLAAELVGIKRRICHSHSTNWQKDDNLKEKIILKILRSIIRFSATEYCSCSVEAGKFLFGNRKVQILKNGIDLKQFVRSRSKDRKSVVEELNLNENTKIIGHVGRFSDSKNHLFLLKVLKKLVDNDKSFVALLVGDGPLREEIENEAKKLSILKHIKFLGVRTDIPRLMNAFDVFLFPSKFEGFGIVLLEAQCSGTPCVISNTVPKTSDMGLGLTSFDSLDNSIDSWCTKVIEAVNMERPDPKVIYDEVSSNGYNIHNNIENWVGLYGASE